MDHGQERTACCLAVGIGHDGLNGFYGHGCSLLGSVCHGDMAWIHSAERVLKLLPWVPCRQGSGYHKLKLLESSYLKCDAYLLYYPEGSWIDVHKDEVPGHEHWRYNIELIQPEEGGFLKGSFNYWQGSRRRVNKFRSDFYHEVTKITKGTRLVLSIGWLK